MQHKPYAGAVSLRPREVSLGVILGGDLIMDCDERSQL